MKLHTIKFVKLAGIPPHSLFIVFDEDDVMVDLSPILAQGGVFEPLRDPQVFATAEVEPDGRTLFWRVGEDVVDLCADALWLMAHAEDANPTAE
jgi:hypothetical protein